MNQGFEVRERGAEGARCAYCHEGLGEEARHCPGCATALHSACWDELGSCPTLGCDQVGERPGEAEAARRLEELHARVNGPARERGAEREARRDPRRSGLWLIGLILASVYSLLEIGLEESLARWWAVGITAVIVLAFVAYAVLTDGGDQRPGRRQRERKRERARRKRDRRRRR